MIGALPRAVLFDLDGTLVDSAPDLADAVNAMLDEFRRPRQTETQVRMWIGGGGRELVRRALGGTRGGTIDGDLALEAYQRFIDHYADRVDRRTRLYPGARAVIEWLRERGVLIGCVTNKPARFTLPLLESLGIDVDLATVVSGDTLPVMKPDPAPVLHALRACAVVPTDAVLIGDTITDINAARAAGVRSVWVSYGYSHGQDIDAAAPDARLHSLNELPTVFS